MDEILKPCPFCGSADVRFDQIEFQIVCRNIACAAHPHMFDTKTEAIKAWNTRTQAQSGIDNG
jgi:Lar family restriction alleviation protein